MTENEPMSFARNDIMRAAEAALKAYDQGVEDGVRQERERIREALLSAEAIKVAGDHEMHIEGCRGFYKMTIPLVLDHIGLGAATTEESQK